MLFADRTSAATLRPNQLRLTFSTIAYVLHQALRVFGLAGTELETAQVETIRRRVLKIGAQIRVSVRRVFVRLSAWHPLQRIWQAILANLRTCLPPPLRGEAKLGKKQARRGGLGLPLRQNVGETTQKRV